MYFGDEHTYKLQFDMVKNEYLRRKKVADQPDIEIDY